MNEVLDSNKKLHDIFQKKHVVEERKLKDSLTLLLTEKKQGSQRAFHVLYCSFVNLYLSYGLHLSLPNDGKKTKKIDNLNLFLVTRNSERYFHYIENEKELKDNSNYFLEQVRAISNSEEEFEVLRCLYLGIYQQDKYYFLSLLEKDFAIVDYYLFYMAIRDHIFAIERRKNGEISKKEFVASKKELCVRYSRYKKRNFAFPQPDINDGSVATEANQSNNIPSLPLPTIRYSDSLCEEMIICSKSLYKHTERRVVDNNLRKIAEAQQLGTITEKGQKNHQNLFSNVVEIRMEYLMFPLKMDFDRNTFSLLMQNYLDYQELEEKNHALERVQKEKQDLIDHHAHTWKHIAFPDTVLGVATSLYSGGLSDKKVSEYANKLLVAYQAQQLLTGNLKLLELKYNQNPEQLREKLQHSLSSPEKRGRSLKQLLEQNLKLRLFSMLVDSQQDTNTFRSGEEMTQLLESYVDSFLISGVTKRISIFEWFNEFIYPLTLDQSSLWDKVYMEEMGTTYVVLSDIFSNLILNSLNYGKKDKTGFLEITLGQTEKNTEDSIILDMSQNPEKERLFIIIRNPMERESAFITGSGNGLTSVESNLKWLHCGQREKNLLTVEEVEGNFKVTLYFDKITLIKEVKEEGNLS